MRITDQYKPVQTTVSNVYVAEATSICLQCRNPDGVLAAPVGQDHLPSMPLDRAAAEEMRGNSLKVSQGRFRLDIREFFFHGKGCPVLIQTAQGSCGVPIPGGI